MVQLITLFTDVLFSRGPGLYTAFRNHQQLTVPAPPMHSQGYSENCCKLLSWLAPFKLRSVIRSIH